MSIDDYMEEQERKDAFISIVQYLLDNDYVTDSALAGISRQVVGDGGTEKLSSKQLYRFNNEVLPLIEIRCDNCEDQIDVLDVEAVYIHGKMWCFSCVHSYDKMMDE